MDSKYYFLCALLAFVGGAFSFYFNAVYRGKISSHQFWIPNLCQLDVNNCISIVDTKYGRIFGASNAQLGFYFLFIYALFLIGVAVNWVNPIIPLYLGILTIFLSVYLVFGLIKLKKSCPICISVHLLNLIIFIIQIVLYY